MATTVDFDVNTITFGEALEIERQSGEEFTALVRSRMGQRMVALFLVEQRNSKQPRSWNELRSLRVLDSESWTSPSDSDGLPQKSNGSVSET